MGEAAVIALQCVLLLAGLVLLGLALRQGRAQQWLDSPDRLPFWAISGSDFMLFALLVVVFLALGPILAVRFFGIDLEAPLTVGTTLVHGYAFQLSGLSAWLLFRVHPAGAPPPGDTFLMPAFMTGVRGFFYVLPGVAAAIAVSYLLMEAVGSTPESQDLVEIFKEARGSEILLLVVLTVVVAPISEEVVFRAGLFRFLRARLPGWWPAILSSVVFATLHQNTLTFAPLVLLGCALCLVYQKTGRIITPVILHALFNLNSVLMILFGPEG